METSRKFSQQELRQLMKEKAKSKKVDRIESPIAKYDDKNNLWCIICNTTVQSDSLWSAHLVGKSHKKKIEELKQKKLSKTENNNNRTTNLSESKNFKRSLPLKENEEHVSKKVSKFDKISEFSQKEILIKQAKKSTPEPSASTKVVTDVTQNIDASLPQDFFDDNVNQSEVAPSSSSLNSSESMEVDIKQEALPEGFFDDPFLDAKARKPANKDPFEEQMQLFRKEIAEETLVSERNVEEEIEQLQKEKEITEVEEQLTNWQKVDRYQKRIEEIHRRKLEMRNNRNQIEKHDSDEDDSGDSDSDNINDMNFWRSKDIFH